MSVGNQADPFLLPTGQAPVLLLARQSPTAILSLLGTLNRACVIGDAANGQAAARFGRSGCHTALIDLRDPDLRGIDPDLLEASAEIARVGGSVIVISERSDPALDAFLDRGATQWLSSPFTHADVDRLLHVADRQAERQRGRAYPIDRRGPPPPSPPTEAESLLIGRIAKLLPERREALAVMRIAFTRLEAVNTAFGRETGDALIEAGSGRIRPLLAGATNGTAQLVRTSGAELTALVEGLDPIAQDALARDIVDRIERPFVANGHVVSLGCRIGLADWAPGDEAESLIRRAAAALAEARLSEALPYRRIDAADAGALVRDATLQQDVRHSLDRNEIEIVFQPQIDIATRRMAGVEALARWQHPRHGMLGASLLFSVAARANFMGALSAHIQRQALAQAANWPETLNQVRLSVNLTAQDIALPGFVERFLKLVDDSGFPRERLTVEITETSLIEKLDIAAGWLAALRAGGLRVAIDDFGTGYSSLAYLKALPLDYLKIDRQLAQDIVGTKRDQIVVRSVIDMGRSLDLGIIAEGVETEAQLNLLAREGCTLYQGFLFSGAVPAEDLPALLAPRGGGAGGREPLLKRAIWPVRAKAAAHH